MADPKPFKSYNKTSEDWSPYFPQYADIHVIGHHRDHYYLAETELQPGKDVVLRTHDTPAERDRALYRHTIINLFMTDIPTPQPEHNEAFNRDITIQAGTPLLLKYYTTPLAQLKKLLNDKENEALSQLALLYALLDNAPRMTLNTLEECITSSETKRALYSIIATLMCFPNEHWLSIQPENLDADALGNIVFELSQKLVDIREWLASDSPFREYLHEEQTEIDIQTFADTLEVRLPHLSSTNPLSGQMTMALSQFREKYWLEEKQESNMVVLVGSPSSGLPPYSPSNSSRAMRMSMSGRPNSLARGPSLSMSQAPHEKEDDNEESADTGPLIAASPASPARLSFWQRRGKSLCLTALTGFVVGIVVMTILASLRVVDASTFGVSAPVTVFLSGLVCMAALTFMREAYKTITAYCKKCASGSDGAEQQNIGPPKNQVSIQPRHKQLAESKHQQQANGKHKQPHTRSLWAPAGGGGMSDYERKRHDRKKESERHFPRHLGFGMHHRPHH